MRPLISKSGGEGKGESEKGEIATIPPYKGPQKCTQFAKNRTSSSIYFRSRPTSPSPRMPFYTISIDKRSPPPPRHPFPDRQRTKNTPPFRPSGWGRIAYAPIVLSKNSGGHIDSPVPRHVKISAPKHLQFLSSQDIKEAHSRQNAPSPPTDEQRKRPLRGLDFLLSPFPQSRQEKEKEIQEKHLQFSSSQQIKEARTRQAIPSPTNDEQRKRPLFVRQGRGVLHTPP